MASASAAFVDNHDVVFIRVAPTHDQVDKFGRGFSGAAGHVENRTLIGMRVTRGYEMLPPIPNMARGYMIWNADLASFDPEGSQGGKLGMLVNAMPWNIRTAAGAGYLVGDAADLQAWGDALLAGKLLHGKWRARYFAKGILSDGTPAYVGAENPGKVRAAYCYGGFGTWTDRGHTIYGANGGTFGFSTFTATIPDLHIAVTTLTNLGQTNNAALTTPVLDALMQ